MKKQLGFTLVEVLIAGLIGIFLLAGMTNLFITTNKSVGLSDGMSVNQEAGRFAMDFITRYVRSAGYSEDFSDNVPVLYVDSGAISCAGAAADACAANDPIGIRGDRLAIPVRASSTVTTRSCSGTLIGGAGNPLQIVNVFWVSDESDSLRELRCRTWNRATNDWIDAGPVSIVANIERMDFQVGLASGIEPRQAARYVNIDTDFNNEEIRSIRVSILTTSQDSEKESKKITDVTTREYGLLDGAILSITDGNIRNIFTSTIELPNMISKNQR